MSTSTAEEEKRAEVPVGRSEVPAINITINQESSLAYLVKAVGQCWAERQAAAKLSSKLDPQAPASATATISNSKSCGSGEEKALGGAQILFGVVCISLGVLVQQEMFFYERMRNGAPFWMGGLFIMSGIFSIVSGRRGSYWVFPAVIFNLASIVAGCVALTQGIARIPDLNGFFRLREYLCERRETTTPSYDWRVLDCKRTLWGLMSVAFATRILLLIFSVAGLVVALSYLLLLCCRLRAKNKNYVIVGDPEVPPSCEGQD